jgi:hypothetical protein
MEKLQCAKLGRRHRRLNQLLVYVLWLFGFIRGIRFLEVIYLTWRQNRNINIFFLSLGNKICEAPPGIFFFLPVCFIRWIGCQRLRDKNKILSYN